MPFPDDIDKQIIANLYEIPPKVSREKFAEVARVLGMSADSLRSVPAFLPFRNSPFHFHILHPNAHRVRELCPHSTFPNHRTTTSLTPCLPPPGPTKMTSVCLCTSWPNQRFLVGRLSAPTSQHSWATGVSIPAGTHLHVMLVA